MTLHHIEWGEIDGEQPTYKGYNGFAACHGLEVELLTHRPMVRVNTVNSRGASDACRFDMPLSHLPLLVEKLTDLMNRAAIERLEDDR